MIILVCAIQDSSTFKLTISIQDLLLNVIHAIQHVKHALQVVAQVRKIILIKKKN